MVVITVIMERDCDDLVICTVFKCDSLKKNCSIYSILQSNLTAKSSFLNLFRFVLFVKYCMSNCNIDLHLSFIYL